jgi:hypothetical protein
MGDPSCRGIFWLNESHYDESRFIDEYTNNRSDDLRHYEEQERYPKSTKILAILFAGNFTFYSLQMHSWQMHSGENNPFVLSSDGKRLRLSWAGL